jgi:hypothetical protein
LGTTFWNNREIISDRALGAYLGRNMLVIPTDTWRNVAVVPWWLGSKPEVA